jgi:YebC/PmpR family DNA-binding regulatory protein
MAGHSKWANIKHRKGRSDAKKGKAFTRASKEIISAVKLGGPDPKSNTRLRLALQRARAVNFPSDNIERCIKRASSEDQADYVEMTYELYGHGGVGLIVDIMTDNKNRIASDIRIATNKRGGTIATPGAVAFNFDRKGVIQIPKDKTDEDALFQTATEAGAEDFDTADEFFIITTDPSDLYAIKDTLADKGFVAESAELTAIPKSTIECDVETAKANLALIDWLEQLDDVDVVYHNMSVPEELMA